MAKRRRAVNKSQMIRDALATNPDKSPAEISALLKADGLNVKPQYVSTIKANAKRKPANGRRGRGGPIRSGSSPGWSKPSCETQNRSSSRGAMAGLD